MTPDHALHAANHGRNALWCCLSSIAINVYAPDCTHSMSLPLPTTVGSQILSLKPAHLSMHMTRKYLQVAVVSCARLKQVHTTLSLQLSSFDLCITVASNSMHVTPCM